MRRSPIALAILSLTPLFTLVPANAGWRLEGKATYDLPKAQPLNPQSPENERDYPVSLDEVWEAAISHLSAALFALDQVLKDSHLITLSFSVPDPRIAIDCGTVRSWVSNMRGRRDYEFASASPSERYEYVENGHLFAVERTLSLEGKINVRFTARPSSTAHVRVNTRYVVQKKSVIHVPLDIEPPVTRSATFAFNTGEVGADQEFQKCQALFVLERAILDGIEKQLRSTKPSS